MSEWAAYKRKPYIVLAKKLNDETVILIYPDGTQKEMQSIEFNKLYETVLEKENENGN